MGQSGRRFSRNVSLIAIGLTFSLLGGADAAWQSAHGRPIDQWAFVVGGGFFAVLGLVLELRARRRERRE
jgi:hypothetical protein